MEALVCSFHVDSISNYLEEVEYFFPFFISIDHCHPSALTVVCETSNGECRKALEHTMYMN
jgi:hypothetical protein